MFFAGWLREWKGEDISSNEHRRFAYGYHRQVICVSHNWLRFVRQKSSNESHRFGMEFALFSIQFRLGRRWVRTCDKNWIVIERTKRIWWNRYGEKFDCGQIGERLEWHLQGIGPRQWYATGQLILLEMDTTLSVQMIACGPTRPYADYEHSFRDSVINCKYRCGMSSSGACYSNYHVISYGQRTCHYLWVRVNLCLCDRFAGSTWHWQPVALHLNLLDVDN